MGPLRWEARGVRGSLPSPPLQAEFELVVMSSPLEAVRLQQSFKFTLCQGSNAWFGMCGVGRVK